MRGEMKMTRKKKEEEEQTVTLQQGALPTIEYSKTPIVGSEHAITLTVTGASLKEVHRVFEMLREKLKMR